MALPFLLIYSRPRPSRAHASAPSESGEAGNTSDTETHASGIVLAGFPRSAFTSSANTPKSSLEMEPSQLDPLLRDGGFAQSAQSSAYGPPIAPNISQSPIPQQRTPQFQQLQQQQQYGSPHSNTFLPHTPSAGNATDNDGGHDDGSGDPKRPRACEACRGLKVRCEPDPSKPEGPCKRCAKANRNCVITRPSRKRQKKTDSRVAELEKKIDALTASLHAQQNAASASLAQPGENGLDQGNPDATAQSNPYQQVTNGGYGVQFTGRPDTRREEWTGYPKEPEFEQSRKPSGPPMVMAGQKRKHTEGHDYPSSSNSPASGANLPKKAIDPFLAHQGMPPDGMSKAPTHEYADVIDRGIVSTDMAAKMFDCYVTSMGPHMPAVVFPAGTTAAEVRKAKPTLFLAILSAAAGSNYPSLQRVLTKEVMGIYADRIIINGEKTLELIQALHISTLWYWPPEHFEELKFYQLIHVAAVMAIDIGLSKKSKSNAKAAGLWRDHPWRRTPYPDSESIEARRTWLSCYFLCCNAAMGLRRPNLIRWTPFMAECVEVLETSPEAAPTDKGLCQWVRSQHIAEDVGTQFSMDDPLANVSLSEPKVQYALRGFEMELAKWSSSIPVEARSPCLKMTEHVVNLYMHEIAMHVDHNVDEFKPPFTEETLKGISEESQAQALTPIRIEALSTCLIAIDGIFETFLKFDVETVRCLPVSNFVRVAYAVVVLIKMYFAAATPNSELGKVINKNNMKVEQYLDGLVEIFKAAALDDKSRPAAKFLMVLMMLKAWFVRQKETRPQSMMSSESATAPTNGPEASAEANSDTTQSSLPMRNGQQSAYSPANTPLQLLSEVATGNSRGQSRSGSVSQYPVPTQNEWLAQLPNYPHMTQLQQGGYPNTNAGANNIDPYLGMDFSYQMGDTFEQAMGMTLGGPGDFGMYFGDDIIPNVLPGGYMDMASGTAGFDGY